jgi:N-acetylglucosamine-6-phosphate deacetylase
VLQHHAVWVEEGLIKALVKADDPHLPQNLPQIDLPETAHLIPGMIDMHIHGAKGSDVMDATEEALQTISEALSEEGVTGYLATTMTESPARIEAALKAVAAYRQKARSGSQILGVHLEGPFLSTQFPGAQQSTEICVPDVDLFDHWQSLAGGAIAQVTLAPEQPGALNFIRHLISHHL